MKVEYFVHLGNMEEKFIGKKEIDGKFRKLY